MNSPRTRTFALVGNPNTGKTTLFNALTGLRQKVANYPGVTVEKKTGTGRNRHGEAFAVIDLPGAYSLEPKSPDEEVTRAVLHGERPDTPRPDAVICLVDAGNLERHLYLATQVMELDLPVIVVVNKTDTAEERGVTVATKKLAERLGVPVVPMQANERVGMEALQVALSAEPVKANWKPVEGGTAARYKAIGELIEGAVARDGEERLSPSDRWDRMLVHPVFGWLVLLGILGGLFFTLFSLAGYPMDLIDGTFGWLSSQVEARMADGDLRALITEGIIGGVGGVVIFLPQILILFFFIGLMENTGYLARVSFMMDRLMAGVGLNGKAFVPLLSSYACAIPGIMATRTMESARDRLITTLVAPITSCSARLPVYVMLIALMLPVGTAGQKALVMLGLYVLSIVGVYAFAYVFNRTLDRKEQTLFVLELPAYQRPSWREIGLQMYDRGKIFLRRAGTVILGLSIVLWALTTYPKTDSEDGSEQLAHSAAGRMGKAIEPVIEPLGYDWKMGIGLVASFAAREVFVSTMSIIYTGEEQDDEDSIRDSMATETRANGEPAYNVRTCLSLLVFYVFAMQCLSTVAVTRRETNSWKWAILQVVYLTGFAYVAALATYQIGGFFLS